MKIFLICLGIILGILLILFIITLIIYHKVFYHRFTEPLEIELRPEDYPEVDQKQEMISTKYGDIAVYAYQTTDQPKGIIIVTNGFGCPGHQANLDVHMYFAKRGYIAIGFDAIGTGKSSGKGVFGLPLFMINLDNVIKYVKNKEEYKKYSIQLWGHSLGAYATLAVLNLHKDIKSVVAFAGSNHPNFLLYSYGKRMMGFFMDIIYPFVVLISRLKFPKQYSSLEGLKNSNAKAFIVQGTKDDLVTPQSGFLLYQKHFKEDERFHFVIKDGGHVSVLFSDEFCSVYSKVLDDYAEYKKNKGKQTKREFINERFTVDELKEMLDYKLFGEILKMYDENA